MDRAVLTCGELGSMLIERLLARYGVWLIRVPEANPIPASFWGGSEAGIRGTSLYARDDTPVHSLLHELSHVACMSSDRRAGLDRNAGSDDDEESAVCYLQVLVADYLPRFGRERCFDDMDAWGYSFREGSVRNWFAGDGRDARAWLKVNGLIDVDDQVLWRLRT